MSITLRYFASVREAMNCAQEAWPEGVALPATAGAVRDVLVAQGEPWSKALAGDSVLRIAVNHHIVDASHAVGAGDEVAFFPPVTGG